MFARAPPSPPFSRDNPEINIAVPFARPLPLFLLSFVQGGRKKGPSKNKILTKEPFHRTFLLFEYNEKRRKVKEKEKQSD